jgi:hypothetical protein
MKFITGLCEFKRITCLSSGPRPWPNVGTLHELMSANISLMAITQGFHKVLRASTWSDTAKTANLKIVTPTLSTYRPVEQSFAVTFSKHSRQRVYRNVLRPMVEQGLIRFCNISVSHCDVLFCFGIFQQLPDRTKISDVWALLWQLSNLLIVTPKEQECDCSVKTRHGRTCECWNWPT